MGEIETSFSTFVEKKLSIALQTSRLFKVYQTLEAVKMMQIMKFKDLRSLYNSVSLALPDRNGYVVDHNKLLAALMGSNTNALFLGSREQSKGALFYIGLYINKK